MFEIKVTVDLSDRVVNLMQSLIFAERPLAVLEETAKEAPAKEAPAKEAPAKEAPAKEAPAKEAPAKLKITDLRALLREKVNNDDNREKLTKKLKELGASSVTSLDTQHYDDFYAYMQSL